MTLKPTEAQILIYDFVENGKGNGIIDAVAGAGKTTTLMGCVEHIHNPKMCYIALSILVSEKKYRRSSKLRGKMLLSRPFIALAFKC